MNAKRLAERLGAKRRGEWWDTRCPAHDDRSPSLSFRDNSEHKRVDVLCRKVCKPAAIATGWGLSLRELFHDAETLTNGQPGQIQLEATYGYYDEARVLLYEVLRYRTPDGRKTFKQRRPDGRGWIWSLDGVRRVLYALPELIAAMRASPPGERLVFIPEGEQDVESLRGLGLVATCNPGGAGKWSDAYTAQLLAAGVEGVVILRDNDTAGERHADKVIRSCVAAELVVRAPRLPGLPPLRDKHGEDISDWLVTGHGREELTAVVAAAPILAKTAAETPSGDEARADGPVLVRLADVEPEVVSWIWPGRLARGKLTLLFGDPGLGKSFLTLDVAAHITKEREWPDTGRAPQGHVIVLSAEDGVADTIRPRIDALGGDAARVDVLTAVRDGPAEHPFSLARDLAALELAVRDTNALLVIVDPIAAYLGKTDSHRDSEVRGVLAPLASLAERQRVGILTVMHPSKAEQRRAIHRAGGSVGFTGAARVVLGVGSDEDDEARRFLVWVKGNLSPRAPTLAYRIAGIPPRVEWEPDPVEDVDAESVLGPHTPEDREARREADDLLRELLAGGEVEATRVIAAAQAHQIHPSTLYRARRRLGVRTRHEGQPGKSGGHWRWFIPPPGDGPPKRSPRPSEISKPGTPEIFEERTDRTAESARTSPKISLLGVLETFDEEVL